MSEIPKTEIDELRQLIRLASDAGNTSADWNGERLKACIVAGKKFAEIKARLGHGKWGRWIESSEMGLSTRTAQKWLALAALHADGKLDIASSGGIRKAYLLAGIIPDSDGSKGADGEPKEKYMLDATRLLAGLKRLDVGKLSNGQVDVLLAKLADIEQQRERIAGIRSGPGRTQTEHEAGGMGGL